MVWSGLVLSWGEMPLKRLVEVEPGPETISNLTGITRGGPVVRTQELSGNFELVGGAEARREGNDCVNGRPFEASAAAPRFARRDHSIADSEVKSVKVMAWQSNCMAQTKERQIYSQAMHDIKFLRHPRQPEST